MNNNDKKEFFDIFTKTADLYGKTIPPERVKIYWEALSHRTLAEIRKAINLHVQDSSRGRFFPLPADISAQLEDLNPWLSANEAWALCPKDENSSVAMCDEIGQALSVASDLINSGDMVAARMAFMENYNRLIGDAKRNNQKPKWFPSYGHDKENRYIADIQVVERKNMALPYGEKLALPEPQNVETLGFDSLMMLEKKHNPNPEARIKGMGSIKDILKRCK